MFVSPASAVLPERVFPSMRPANSASFVPPPRHSQTPARSLFSISNGVPPKPETRPDHNHAPDLQLAARTN